MKSNFIKVITALLLICTMLPIQAKAAVQFSDIQNHWAKNEIMYLSSRNIIGGYPDGTFKPNEPITRAQASAMLIKALNIPLTEKPSVHFKDVSEKSPYYRILATVNEKGILRGDSGYMRPGEKTSRAQMAAILRRSFDMPLDKQATFIDVTPAHWAYQDINGIAKQRVTGGSDGKFMPSNAVTRAQFSAFLVRAMDDNMKLSKYRSYVSTKGKTVEQDGVSYFTKRAENGYQSLVKENKKTGEQKELLNAKNIEDFPGDFSSAIHLHENTRIVLYNDDLYIPYWSGGFAEADEIPYAFDVMKMNKDGQGLSKVNTGHFGMLRNMFIWNDRIFYINNGERSAGSGDYREAVLELYSTAMDGHSNKRKEFTFNALVTFDDYDENTPGHVREAGGEFLSVLYDHSAVYYLNKKGVYKYNLLDKKVSKLSAISAHRMEVTDKELFVTDEKGKRHALKK